MGPHGLGKTMIAQNLCHAAVPAGQSDAVPFHCRVARRLAPAVPEGRRKLRTLANVGLLCIDEVGYLSFDDKAAACSMKS